MTDFFNWLSGGSTSAIAFISVISIVVVGITTMYIGAFLQGREISFYPPKIGEKPKSDKHLTLRPDSEKESKFLSPRLREFGLEDIFHVRSIALEYFVQSLAEEIQRANNGDKNARIWIVATSLKGFIETSAEQFNGRSIMTKIARSKCELRIMMADPEIVYLIEQQERRVKDDIKNEIWMNLALLKRIGVMRKSLRFYYGMPTVFAIATSNKMLLNPHTYGTESFRSFSLIVNKTPNPTLDVYHQYLKLHFEYTWNKAKPISVVEWDKL
jgi:hypothetical protein